jgi:hypothetical protein
MIAKFGLFPYPPIAHAFNDLIQQFAICSSEVCAIGKPDSKDASPDESLSRLIQN